MAKFDSHRTVLQRVAAATTDEYDKLVLEKLAQIKSVDDKCSPNYYAEQVAFDVKHWDSNDWKGSNRYFGLIESCLQALKATHKGEWRKKDMKGGPVNWVVSWRKFTYFRDKCNKLEAENAALKQAIHAITEVNK